MSERLAALGPPLVVTVAALLALRRLDNTDTLWHLAAGRWIVEHGTVPATDTLSYTVNDHAWVNVQWLFDVVLHALERLGGPTALVVTSALAYTAATALMLVNVRQALGPVGAAVLGAWATVVAQERFAIRPETASFLLLQVVLWAYATGRSPPGRRLWVLPVAMALWANMHSLFIVGAVVIVAHMVGTVVQRLPVLPAGWSVPRPPQIERLVLVTGAAALAATVINPFGVRGALFPLILMSRLGDQSVFQSIGELRPPFSGYFVTLAVTAYQVFFIFAVAVVALALVVTALRGSAANGSGRAARRRGAPAPVAAAGIGIDVGDVAVFVGLAYLSLLARRNMALFAMGTVPFVARCLAILGDALPEAARAARDAATRALAFLLPPVLVAAGWFVVSNGFYRWNEELHEFGVGRLDAMFPVDAAAFAREVGLPGPLYNDFTNGAYLAWDAPIAGGVYIDGRTEVYDVDFFSAYLRQLRTPVEWQVEMDRRGVQSVVFFHWWPNHQTLASHLVKNSRWALLFYDPTSLVLVRRSGNEALIARAEAVAETRRAALEASLLAPVSSWQWAVGRARALGRYVAVLRMVGRGNAAGPFATRLREIGGDV
jgi:hypothetical protein